MEAKELEISYSEEQGMLGDTAGTFFKKKSTFDAVRKWAEAPEGYSKEMWQEMADLGWMGIAIPEAYGGSGLGAPELVTLMEPMGRYVFASPFLATTLAGQLLLAAGSQAHKAKWLPEVASGKRIATIALSEPDGSWEPEHVKASAERTAAGYRLTGTKCFVLDGPNADLMIGAFLLGGKPALFLLEPEAVRGLRQTREQLVDMTRRSSRISFDGVEVPGAALMTEDGLPALQKVLRLAWVLLAADMAGGAEGVLQLTLEYLKIRKQFGKTIGAFQGLKHPAVNIMMDIENARSLLYYAATVYGPNDKESEVAARMVKAFASELHAYAAGRAVQIHGGMGFTWECHAHLFMRRAHFGQFTFGDARHHRRHLAELML